MSAEPATLLLEESGDETINGFTYRRTYDVWVTDENDGALVALSAANLPLFNQAFEGDALSRVNSRRPIRMRDAKTHWNVEVGYAREKGNQQDKQNPPTLRPVKRSAKINWVERALMFDRNGDPILTSAKTPFNPPLTRKFPHSVAVFQRWEATFTTATQRQYAGKVNSEPFGDFAAGEVMCINLEATEEWEQNASGDLQRYWLVTYEFEAAIGDWKWSPTKILDADYWFIDPGDGKRKPIYVDADGAYSGPPDPTDENSTAVPVPTPVPLSGAEGSVGDVLQASELPASAHYLEFDLDEAVDFNALGLPVD